MAAAALFPSCITHNHQLKKTPNRILFIIMAVGWLSGLLVRRGNYHLLATEYSIQIRTIVVMVLAVAVIRNAFFDRHSRSQILNGRSWQSTLAQIQLGNIRLEQMQTHAECHY